MGHAQGVSGLFCATSPTLSLLKECWQKNPMPWPGFVGATISTPQSPHKWPISEAQLAPFGWWSDFGAQKWVIPKVFLGSFEPHPNLIIFEWFSAEKSHALTRICRGHYVDLHLPLRMAGFQVQLAPFGGGRISGHEMYYYHGIWGISVSHPQLHNTQKNIGKEKRHALTRVGRGH